MQQGNIQSNTPQSPPGFLPALSSRLPNLTALTLYAVTLGGPSPQGTQKEDALHLLSTPTLRELHAIDVYTSPRFWAELCPPGLKVVELAYKSRGGEDEGLFEFIDVDGIVDFVGKLRDVVGLTVCWSPDESEGGGRIDVVRGEQARSFVGAVKGLGTQLAVFDATMFALRLEDVKTVLTANPKLRVLAVSVILDGGWEKVLAGLSETESGVEDLEVVGVELDSKVSGAIERVVMIRFDEKWKELRSVKVSILRNGSEHWVKENGTWRKAT